jgi:hypothetical protein
MHIVAKVVDTVAAPIGEVWSIISGFGGIKLWMPAVESCSLEGYGVGAVRLVKVNQGFVSERLEEVDPTQHRVVYRVLEPSPLPMKDAVGSIQLTALGPKSTRLEWVARAASLDVPKEQIEAFTAPFYRTNIDKLKELLGSV